MSFEPGSPAWANTEPSRSVPPPQCGRQEFLHSVARLSNPLDSYGARIIVVRSLLSHWMGMDTSFPTCSSLCCRSSRCCCIIDAFVPGSATRLFIWAESLSDLAKPFWSKHSRSWQPVLPTSDRLEDRRFRWQIRKRTVVRNTHSRVTGTIRHSRSEREF